MVKFEDRKDVLNEKVGALVGDYEVELKKLANAIDHNITEKEWGVAGYLEAHREAFFGQMEKLSHQIKEVVFDEIRQKKTEKPEFKKFQDFLEQKLKPLHQTFRENYQKIAKEMLGEGLVEGALKAFDGDLGKLLIRLFMTYAQEFDDL